MFRSQERLMKGPLDPKTAGPTIKVEIDFSRNSGRADFIVPLQAERRYGGYRAVSHRVVRSKPHGIDVYEVEMKETGEPKSFVGPYEAND
jgi:hypothetical protein